MKKDNAATFESVRREIARRLQAGLPLAGMIAATTLLTGCHEHSENFPAGSVPRDPALCEQQTEKPKPKTPPPKKNGTSEVGERPLAGIPAPPPNRKNETERPPTPGRSSREKSGK